MAIEVMKELDDQNLASMIQHVIKDHITYTYEWKIVLRPFSFTVSSKGYEVTEHMNEEKEKVKSFI